MLEQRPIENTANRERESIVICPLTNVREPPRREVVEHVDLIPPIHQAIRQVAADKAGATREKVTHSVRLLP